MRTQNTSRHWNTTLVRYCVIALFALLGKAESFAQPSNDNFANAILIAGGSAEGTNVGATREDGEPETVAWGTNPRSPLGGKSVWWKWIAPTTGKYTVKTGDKSGSEPSSTFNTQLGVYTGSSLANLVEVGSNESDSDFPNGLSKVDFEAQQGKTYYFLVDGFEGGEGSIAIYIGRTRYFVLSVPVPFEAGSILLDPPQPTDGYLAGSIIVAEASPSEGQKFYGWTGAARGATNRIRLTMNSNKTIVAHFSFISEIFWQRTNNYVATWLMTTNQLLNAISLGKADAGLVLSGAGDFDTNGSTDLVFQRKSGEVAMWLMDGSNRIDTVTFTPDSAKWRLAAVGDISNDGKPDLIFQNTNGWISAWLMDGTQRVGVDSIGGTRAGWRLITAADMNGDEKNDLIFQHRSGSVAAWLMDGSTRTSVVNLGLAQPTWRLVSAQDLDGDGDADLFFENPKFQIARWTMNGITRVSETVMRQGQSVDAGWRALAGH